MAIPRILPGMASILSRSGGVAALALLGLVVGCKDPESSDGSVAGTLGRSRFFYTCVAASDPQCDERSNLAPNVDGLSFPPVAVGARFRIGEESDFGTGVTRVRPLGDFFDYEEASQAFVAVRAGVGGVVSESVNDEVVDFAQIELATPTRLKLLFATEVGNFQSGAVTIEPGGVRGGVKATTFYDVRVFPVDDKDRPLAGAFPIEWSTSAPATLKFRDPNRLSDNVVSLETGVPGRATLSVKVGTLTASFEVEVTQ